MSIHIGKPYKIISLRNKRYDAHYNIPSDNCLIVPLKEYGDEALCDVRWEDANGLLQVIHNRMFVSENLVPLDPALNEKLFELWDYNYGKGLGLTHPDFIEEVPGAQLS